MTPAERQLVTDLFDRLTTLEDAARDPEAERLIKDGLRQAPNAVYALVQSVLVQDEALKRADARIRELEAELGIQPEPQRSGGFLDNMRETFFGRQEEQRHGSVPSVRSGEAPMGAPSGFSTGAQPAPPEPSRFGGGSFLGTAAAAAAGVIGGSLLLDGIRSMTGQRGGGGFGMADSAAARENPWGASGGSAGDLGRQAGVDDIGRGGIGGERSADQGYGLFDTTSDKIADADFTDDDIADADFDGGLDLGGDGGGGGD